MKTNLKTFPHCLGCEAFQITEDEPVGSCSLRQPLDHERCLAYKWKRDFEAELRNFLKETEDHKKNTKHEGWDWYLCENMIKVYKEVLGDD